METKTEQEVVVCPKCNGTDSGCLACEGRGKVKQCELCKGSGYDISNEIDAKHDACHGTGYLPAK